MNQNVADRALSWLDSRILSHEGCIERLAGIKNDAVNVQAQDATLRRMRDELDLWRFMRDAVSEKSTQISDKCL